MDLLERAIFLAIGMGVGFILGYIVRSLRDIKEELDEVEHFVRDHDRDHHDRNVQSRPRDETGSAEVSKVNNLVLLFVVLLVAYAAFMSQKSSNDAQRTQEQLVEAQKRIDDVTFCNQEILQDLLTTVNARTTFTADQARANIELQRNQSKFLGFLLTQPPRPEEERAQALRDYFDSLNNFIEVNSRQAERARANPYPTVEDFYQCIEDKQGERQHD